MKNSWLVFTDLDGTLLDAQNYSFASAWPAVRLLKEKKIPVVPCTSKTHREVILLRRQLGLKDPFIVENGSAVFIPRAYFNQPVSDFEMEGHEVLLLGKKHEEILHCFEKMRQNFKLRIRGFSEMSLQEIRKHTGLPEDQARLAKQRFFSEPFISDHNLNDLPELHAYLKKRGCRLLRGNRFYHLLGDTDKGRAVNVLHHLFEAMKKRKFRTLGLGDSKNDEDLLTAVDQPVLVKRPDGGYGSNLLLPHLYKTEQPGPKGWREAIEHFVS